MTSARSRPTIHIAAALIDDGAGRILLVRKVGTRWFMQAGGKIERGETALAALRRELLEEIGLDLTAGMASYLGRFTAEAANEPSAIVEAEIFHIRALHHARISAEIEEAVWVGIDEAERLPLAPLTRIYVLPLARKSGLNVR